MNFFTHKRKKNKITRKVNVAGNQECGIRLAVEFLFLYLMKILMLLSTNIITVNMH